MRSGPGPVTGWPLRVIVPSTGRRNPAIALSSVDFPQPEAEQHQPIGAVDIDADPIGRGDEMFGCLVLQRDAVDPEQRTLGRGCHRINHGLRIAHYRTIPMTGSASLPARSGAGE